MFPIQSEFICAKSAEQHWKNDWLFQRLQKSIANIRTSLVIYKLFTISYLFISYLLESFR